MPEILFHGKLAEIVSKRAKQPPVWAFPRAAKDLVETLGIPHTEVARIRINGRDSDFLAPVNFEDRLEVYPHTPPRPSPWNADGTVPHPGEIAFIADNNVAGAGKLLRLIGFDTSIDSRLDDREICIKANRENRVVLSRDRNLLKRRIVAYGCLLRAEDPWRQLEEVVLEYGLARLARPFSRCLHCNGILVPVEKEKVLDRLLPLTRLYYDAFNACNSCGRIFWRGSHVKPILQRLEPILGSYQASE